jgi:hypothetical protein
MLFSHLKEGEGKLVILRRILCVGVPRIRNLVPLLGTILLWGEGAPFSHLLLLLPPMARVVGKTFGSFRFATTLTGMTLTKSSLIYFITLYN